MGILGALCPLCARVSGKARRWPVGFCFSPAASAVKSVESHRCPRLFTVLTILRRSLDRSLNFCRKTDDLYDVTIDEDLIRDVFLKVGPGDLDQVLTAIEAYRVCVSTLDKLQGTGHVRQQKRQVMECARSCERALFKYVATGCWTNVQYPPAGRTKDFQKAHLVLRFEW